MMRKENLKLLVAFLAFVVAAFIAIMSLFIPPHGVIDSSALWAVAQFLIMCCTILGIEAELEKFLFKFNKECEKLPKS